MPTSTHSKKTLVLADAIGLKPIYGIALDVTAVLQELAWRNDTRTVDKPANKLSCLLSPLSPSFLDILNFCVHAQRHEGNGEGKAKNETLTRSSVHDTVTKQGIGRAISSLINELRFYFTYLGFYIPYRSLCNYAVVVLRNIVRVLPTIQISNYGQLQ